MMWVIQYYRTYRFIVYCMIAQMKSMFRAKKTEMKDDNDEMENSLIGYSGIFIDLYRIVGIDNDSHPPAAEWGRQGTAPCGGGCHTTP